METSHPEHRPLEEIEALVQEIELAVRETVSEGIAAESIDELVEVVNEAVRTILIREQPFEDANALAEEIYQAVASEVEAGIVGEGGHSMKDRIASVLSTQYNRWAAVADSVGNNFGDWMTSIHGRMRRFGRSHMITVRVSGESIAKMDDLREAGLVESRAEAAEYLILEGIKARSELFGQIEPMLTAIRSAKEDLKKLKDERFSRVSAATGLSDNSVLMRVPPIFRRSRRQAIEPGIPQKEFERPILEVLRDLGGSGETRDVLDAVGLKMRHRLQPVEYKPVGGGQIPRWEMHTHWARKHLINDGLLRNDSPRGLWELTEAGIARAKDV